MSTLTIPPRTRLYSIERIETRLGIQWAIWINTNGDELQNPHEHRNGTYLLLKEDGTAERVTIDGDSEETMDIME